MFGWINDCTESLVVTKFGIEKWHEIKKVAKCSIEDDGFIRHEYYTDNSTIELVVAAAQVLGIAVDDVLEAFGQHFMEFTRGNGYDNLLSCQGSTLRLWLSNLNALHDHLQSALPKGFVAPVFWAEDDDQVDHEGSILLHYYSERGCLLVPIVVGVVVEVARYHFQLQIIMDRLQMQTIDGAKFTTWRVSTEDPGERWKLTATVDGHVVEDPMQSFNTGFHPMDDIDTSMNNPLELKKRITFGASVRGGSGSGRGSPPVGCPFNAAAQEMSTNMNSSNQSMSEKETAAKSFWKRIFKKKEAREKRERSNALALLEKENTRNTEAGTVAAPEESVAQCPHAHLHASTRSIATTNTITSATPKDDSISITAYQMTEVFPYHVVVDEEFQILQVGKSLSNLIGIPKTDLLNRHIQEVLEIKRPILGSWDWNTLNKLQDQTFFLQSLSLNATKLKANIIKLSRTPKRVLFVISPDAKNVQELTSMKLTMSDLPLHSFQRDAVFLGEHMYSEVRSAHQLDKLSKKLANEKNLSNTLLYSMLPEEVANLLRSGKAFEPQHHDNVTLFFSDVVGFTKMSTELAPWEIIDMLNTLYTVMDFLAARFDLYKVETIGDAYMCCSGLPMPDPLHAEKVANFAIAVKSCVSLVKSPLTNEPIRLRIGMHTGSCMSGVVGTLTPHYCLFGDMINTTSRHESTGEADRIQASSITFGKLSHFSENPEHFNWTPRGLVEMKGKGEMFTYWLDSGGDSNPHVGPQAMVELVEEVEAMLSTKTWKKRKYFTRKFSGSASIASASSGNTEFDDNYQSMVHDAEVPEIKTDASVGVELDESSYQDDSFGDDDVE